ncbi:MAG: VOC family protein [Gemmatimonadetes bacterium]|nr:VOC family protein [Gemmatimonadota bacterium]
MSAPPVTAGFHHVTLVARDARRTLAFYRDLLGLGLVKRTVNFDDPGAYHLYFGDDTGAPGTIFTFFEWTGARPGAPGIGGIHHHALGVADGAAQLKWKRRLTDAGVAVTGPLERGYFRSIYFRDPDGQVLEIATAGPGYAIDEPATRLGEKLTAPPASQLPDGRDMAAIRALTHPEPVPVITPDMALQGIHHVTGMTDDIGQLHEFLDRTLGLRRIKRSVNQDDPATPHHFWANYDGSTVAPHSSFTFFGWPPNGRLARPGAGQTHHVAFRASSAEQQLAWREHLLSQGVDVSPVMDRTYFSSIYFQAPDGLLLEIATDGPGFALDEANGELGRVLKLPAWLEASRPDIERRLAPL